ncbi:hypothetical protein Hanom_Chr12g01100231 [Helianthus anomalus]
MKETRYVYVKYFLIVYTHTNTNIGSHTKLFLWFRLVINPFDIRFKHFVSPILNFVKALGHIFSSSNRVHKFSVPVLSIYYYKQ